MRLFDALSGTMRTLRTRRIGRAEAERLLTGQPTADDRSALAGLLSAAAGPPRSQELAGEPAIRSAFVRAQLTPLPDPAQLRKRRAVRVGGMATVKVAAVVAVVITGGTAFAAETGHLPDAAQRRAHDLFSGLGVPAPATAPATSGPAVTIPASAPPSSRHSASPDGPDTSPAGVLALCRAWDAAEHDPQGKKLAAEDLRALLAAAGNSQGIPKLCRDVLSASSTPTPTLAPTPPATPPGRDKGKPSKSPRK